jgi:hypothetical protein
LQTDPNNCGACGVVCAGVCSPGQCLVTLASGQPIPVAIAVDSTSVYWVDQMGSGGPGTFGGVVKVGLNGGTEAVLAWGRQVASGIALDATSVYWVDAGCPGDGGPCERAVLKVPLGGGALGTVVTGSPGDVAADGTNVYWTDSSAGTVMKVPAGGGAAVTLVSGQPGAGRILVDSTSVYWTAGGQLLSAPLAGGAATTLASANPNSLALGTSFIFWTDDSAGAVMSVGHHGGPVIPLVTGLTNPAGIAVDSAAVYWTMPGTMCTNSADGGVTCNGGVMKCSLAGCGGPPTTLASGQAALAIAVDDTSVYWTTGSSVMKLTPK